MSTVRSSDNIKKVKPTYRTEKVKLDNGTTVDVGRVSLEDMDTALEIQDRLLEHYIKADGALGEFITDNNVRSDLTTFCGLIPIITNKNTEQTYLNFEDIQDNWEQLVTLFFNGSFNEDTRSITNLTAGRISLLHFFPHGKTVDKYLTQLKNEKEKA